MTKDLQIGNAALVHKHLCFLSDKYGMKFSAAELPDAYGVEDPTYLYSYYNESGCFSVCEVAQRGEWDCYTAHQYDIQCRGCLEKRIDQRTFLKRNVFFARSFLKAIAKEIERQIACTGEFWGITPGEHQ